VNARYAASDQLFCHLDTDLNAERTDSLIVVLIVPEE